MARSDKEKGTGTTMGSEATAPSDRNALTIGPNGPILLHDVRFLEQMAHFNREAHDSPAVRWAPAAWG